MGKGDISEVARKLGPDKIKPPFKKALEKSEAEPGKNGVDELTDEAKWASGFLEGAESSHSLSTLKIDPPVPLIDDWSRVGDLGFIFARRGLGKTWPGVLG